MSTAHKEKGAAAVEAAILLPVLLLLLFGVMEFAYAFHTQITLTNAARDGVRVMAITNNPDRAREAATAAASTLNPGLVASNFSPAPTTCPTGTAGTTTSRTTFTIQYELSTLTGIAGPFTMTGKGTMRCGG